MCAAELTYGVSRAAASRPPHRALGLPLRSGPGARLQQRVCLDVGRQLGDPPQSVRRVDGAAQSTGRPKRPRKPGHRMTSDEDVSTVEMDDGSRLECVIDVRHGRSMDRRVIA